MRTDDDKTKQVKKIKKQLNGTPKKDDAIKLIRYKTLKELKIKDRTEHEQEKYD
jgi:hypothetical protein